MIGSFLLGRLKSGLRRIPSTIRGSTSFGFAVQTLLKGVRFALLSAQCLTQVAICLSGIIADRVESRCQRCCGGFCCVQLHFVHAELLIELLFHLLH